MRTLFPASPVRVEPKLVYRSYSYFFPQEEEAEVVCLHIPSVQLRHALYGSALYRTCTTLSSRGHVLI